MNTSFQFSIFCIFLFLGLSYQEDRKQRLFSLFNVVKFKNTGCQSTSTADLQGVCYTKEECTDGGGMSDGNCAAGFGVCCIFVVSGTTASCGGTVTRNCSYIENPEYPATRATAGNCAYMVTRCSTEICQIRLDFKSTTTLNQPAALTGVCDTDSLTIAPGATTTAANTIPLLCGTITDMHMYLDAGNSNDLASTLTFAITAGGTKSWRIKVSQIECSSSSRAPNGCLQYFTGTMNTVKSYNWDGSVACATGCQLANQDYNVCFREEKGMCGISYTPSVVTAGINAFNLAVKVDADIAKAQQGHINCAMNAAGECGLTDDNNSCSFIQIPGAFAASAANAIGLDGHDIFCGDFLNYDDDALVSGAVSSTARPFRFRHVVIGKSIQMAVALAGYSLDATQTPC